MGIFRKNSESKVFALQEQIERLQAENRVLAARERRILSDIESERKDKQQILDMLTVNDTKKLGFATAKLIRDMQSDISEYQRGIMDITTYLLNQKGENMSVLNSHREFHIIWDNIVSQRRELDKLKSQINEQ